MDRRTFVTLVAGTYLLGPRAVCAQQPGKVFKIGLLAPVTGQTPGDRIDVEALRSGLRDLGWVEGKNLLIETRWAGENPQRQRELAAELKALPVALIITVGTTAIRAARDGAPGVPVVCWADAELAKAMKAAATRAHGRTLWFGFMSAPFPENPLKLAGPPSRSPGRWHRPWSCGPLPPTVPSRA